MIRAGKNSHNPLIIMGLSEENVRRLKQNKPIHASIRSFGVNLPGEILVMYGPTEQAIAAELERNGIVGQETVAAVDPKLEKQTALIAQHERILIATVGFPRSGKTTWAKTQSYPIVNPDAIRLAMHGQRFIAEAERFVWATAHAMVKSLFLAGHQIVILDACNNSRKRRAEWESTEWATFYKVVDTSAEACFDRAAGEGDTEIIPHIERMAKEHDPLAETELVWP